MNFSKRYYEILGVSNRATKEDIRAAYRRLAKVFHPDRNPGNQEAEIRMKEIVEANEVLSNDILRGQYDKYLEKELEWKKASQTGSAASESNTVTRKRQRVNEKRIYIRGKLRVKYWADQVDESFMSRDGDVVYRVHPNDAEVDIEEQNIFPLAGVPLYYMKAFSASDLFASPLPRPTRCRIVSNGTEVFYNLELHDVRVKDIHLEGITKFENTNLGTLTGDIYAYVIETEIVEEEYEEEVPATFGGQTGRTETREENNTSFARQEFYHADGSTYWGEWYKTGTTYVSPRTPFTKEAFGCLQWWWLPFVFFFLLRIPGFLYVFGGLMLLFLLAGLFSLLSRAAGKLIPILGGALLVFLLLAAFGDIFKTAPTVTFPRGNDYDSVSTKREINENDTLISHLVRWQSYDSNRYQATLSISTRDAKSSDIQHASMFQTRRFADTKDIYSSMLLLDGERLSRVTGQFDSIRRVKRLDDQQFAEMMVSCIQSIPYYLVVDRNCSDKYDDDFTRNFLASCKTECCIGQEPFGVRTPAEFITDLKGDCDTRALVLYYLLSYFNYDVALLTSNYYKHALIAVAIPAFGTALNLYGKNYYMWETTSKGFRPGDIPLNIRNTNYWEVSLLNQNR